MNWSDIDKILLVGGMTRMPMIREMIQEISGVPLAEHVSPDEAVAVGAAIQGMLSILAEEDKTGEKTVPKETREQFSNREGGLIQVTNITSHSLGRRALERGLAGGIRVPDDQENDGRAGGVQEQLRHGAGEHGEGGRARGRGREHACRANARRWGCARSICRRFCPRARRWS